MTKTKHRSGFAIIVAAALLGVALSAALLMSTQQGDAAGGETIYAVTTTNQLLTFGATNPGVIDSTVSITGLQKADIILGIDFRPATGQLYGLSSASRLYTIDTTTGVATQVGTDGAFTLSGVDFGYDFNPTVDRIRVVSDADQNQRLNPDTGAGGLVDTNLAYAAGDPNAAANPNVVGSAYTNNVSGAATTTLFGIDSVLDILVTQDPPNAGTLNTIGSLGISASGQVGFDISGTSTIAYAALQGAPAAVALRPALGLVGSQLYTIDTTTGAATLVGTIGPVQTQCAISPPRLRLCRRLRPHPLPFQQTLPHPRRRSLRHQHQRRSRRLFRRPATPQEARYRDWRLCWSRSR